VNDLECRKASELLPELARGTLDAADAARVRAHVSACADCREELALVGLLRRSAAAPPAGLAGRVRAAARLQAGAGELSAPRHTGGMRRVAWWGGSAAAAVVLIVGANVLVTRDGPPSEEELWEAFVDEQVPEWVEDGLVAGAPVLEDLSDLSDEDLALVLQELEG